MAKNQRVESLKVSPPHVSSDRKFGAVIEQIRDERTTVVGVIRLSRKTTDFFARVGPDTKIDRDWSSIRTWVKESLAQMSCLCWVPIIEVRQKMPRASRNTTGIRPSAVSSCSLEFSRFYITMTAGQQIREISWKEYASKRESIDDLLVFAEPPEAQTRGAKPRARSHPAAVAKILGGKVASFKIGFEDDFEIVTLFPYSEELYCRLFKVTESIEMSRERLSKIIGSNDALANLLVPESDINALLALATNAMLEHV